ncbi:MAG: T9SS C-terminal target domain-containing protein [Bacteroidetes bacterium]|nr:T9SS C-terminal target domain-containing protein [Bacteroidota bacterium]
MNIKQYCPIAMLVVFGFVTKINAQTPFTKRQVYDFHPGDVMQTTNKYTQTPGPPIYETDSIAERWTSKLGDTIFYKSKHTYYRAQSCQSCTSEFIVSTVKMVVTDLDSIVKHENKTMQMEFHDSFYSMFCNKNVWANVPGKLDSFWFEPVYHYTYFVEGLGGPYFHIEYRRSLPWFNDRQLTYFKKNGVECGNFVSGIKTINQIQFEITILPNPCSDYALLKFPKTMNRASLVVHSLDGKLLRRINEITGTEYVFHSDGLKPGIYILTISNNGEMGSEKLFIAH